MTYSDITVAVAAWNPYASRHGGLAIVNVTRTQRVVRPTRPEPPQTATYQFRLHRHLDNFDKQQRTLQDGESKWFVIDFLDPELGGWLSETPEAKQQALDRGQPPGPLPPFDPG